MPAIHACTGIVFTNENAGCTLTAFFCAAAIVAWYESGLFVYGCANELKCPMKLCFPANSATSVATARPSSEKPSSVNMNRLAHVQPSPRSEERRVGKECRARWARDQEQKTYEQRQDIG